MKKNLALASCILGLTTLSASANADVHVDEISKRLTGRFDNSAQVSEDPSFAPVDYALCPVNVRGSDWPEGARPTYVEQKIQLPDMGQIIRRRIYLTRQGLGDSQVMDFYDLENDSSTDAMCDIPFENRILDISQLSDSECTMDFNWDWEKQAYVGHTRQDGCPSTYRGASTLEIEGILKTDVLLIWERWYDENHHQVAGSTRGHYVYTVKP